MNTELNSLSVSKNSTPLSSSDRYVLSTPPSTKLSTSGVPPTSARARSNCGSFSFAPRALRNVDTSPRIIRYPDLCSEIEWLTRVVVDDRDAAIFSALDGHVRPLGQIQQREN